jgi:hypothetical protein
MLAGVLALAGIHLAWTCEPTNASPGRSHFVSDQVASHGANAAPCHVAWRPEATPPRPHFSDGSTPAVIVAPPVPELSGRTVAQLRRSPRCGTPHVLDDRPLLL